MAERYQWTQGPYNGQIETVNCETDNDIYFDSGRKCSKQSLMNMMFQINDSEEQSYTGNSLNTFDDEINFGGGKDYGDIGGTIDIPDNLKEAITINSSQVTISSLEKDSVQTVKYIDPYENEKNKTVSNKVEEKSPIAKLFSMQKDESLSTICAPLNLELKWPAQSFIKILTDTFDKELVVNELINYIKEQVNIEKLQNVIDSFIKEETNKMCNIND